MPRLQPLLAPIAIALLLPSSATAQSLSALVSVNSSSLSIASLHQENGTVSRILPPFSASGGGLSGECNAGFDGLRYYKNTADGYLHTVYAPTGHVMGKVALRNHPGKPGTETFLAGPDAEGNLWFAEPLEYTSYSIFKIDSITGVVTEVATLPKQQLDGIGVCVGAIAGNKLLYIVADTLVSFDLTSHNVTEISKGFYAPLALDPSHAGHILALHMGPAVQEPGAPEAPKKTAMLTRVDLSTGVATTLYTFDAAYYHHLCKCKLPIRPQDQADLAVSSDGTRAWAVLSYNEKPVPTKGSLLARGSFAFNVSESGASLVGHAFAWDDESANARLGVMRWVRGA